jgi:hypothetical protein
MAEMFNPLNPEILELSRQRRMADLLTTQGLQTPQGQTVAGGIYVPPNPMEYIAKLYSTYQGTKANKELDAREVALAKALRDQEVQDITRFSELQYGGKQIPAQAQAGPMPDGGNIPIGTTLSEPDPMAAFQLAAQSRSPIIRSQLAEMLKGQKLGEGEVIQRYNPATGKMETTAKGADKTSPEYKNYLIAINDPINPFKGGFTDYQTMLKRAGATSINLPSEGERKAGFMSNILDRNILQMQTALGVDPTAVKPNVPASIVEAITGPNLLSRSMKPAQRQIVEDSQLDVLDAALTLRTGAAYTREQLNAMRDTYFPVIGDKPPAIKEKKQRLETLLSGAYIAAGRATPNRVSETPPTTPPPTGKSTPAPAGVPQNVWNAMTPQEKALFK